MITKKEVLELIQQGKTEELISLGPKIAEPLLAILEYSDLPEIHMIASVLAELAKKYECIFQRLTKELNFKKFKNNLNLRIGCAEALGKTASPVAVIFLLDSLGCDPDPNVRILCAKALGEIGDPRAVDGLKKSIYDYEYVNRASVSALKRIGTQKALNSLAWKLRSENILFDICEEALITTGGLKVLQALIHSMGIMHNGNPSHRDSCVKIFTELGKKDEIFFQGLIHEFENNQNWVVREICARAFELIKNPKAVKVLIEGLKDNRVEVKLACISALGSIGGPGVIDLLIIHLADSSLGFKCAKALENIKDPRGLHFKKIIYDRAESYESVCYISKIGIEKTRVIILEYLEMIKDHYPKEKLAKIKINLFSFYRRAFNSTSRPPMELPIFAVKPKKVGPRICARLTVVI
ncbi:MAG: HEAT repeat domain-containing protein [Candidatus Micrarchaeia archaeon]